MDKFKGKYRIKSARAAWWDYGWSASYFVTICTKNRKHFFGYIRQGKMHLSDIGERVQMEWLKTPEIRPDMNLMLGEFVVMPNHFHGIITIGGMNDNGGRCVCPNAEMRCGCPNAETRCGCPNAETRCACPNAETRCGCANVETRCIASLPLSPSSPSPSSPLRLPSASPTPLNRFAPQSKNLASIIRGFKSSVTTYARKSGNPHFHWQARFHDHVIRDEQAYENISNYIQNNPLKWEQDQFY